MGIAIYQLVLKIIGESSLKISPVEQVILLSELLENKWEFEEKIFKQ